MLSLSKGSTIVHLFTPRLFHCFGRSNSFTRACDFRDAQAHNQPWNHRLKCYSKQAASGSCFLNELQLLTGSVSVLLSFPPSWSWGEGLNNQHSLAVPSTPKFLFPPLSFPLLYFLSQPVVSQGSLLRFLPLRLLVPLILSSEPLFPEAAENTFFSPPFTSLPSPLPSPSLLGGESL